MSYKVTAWVLEFSETRLGDRLVLLALAETADDDGSRTFPSVTTIAMKARLSERQVQRCLVNLVDLGAVERVGISPYQTVEWRVLMRPPDNSSPPTNPTERGDKSDRDPANLSPYPSSNPSNPSLVLENASASQLDLDGGEHFTGAATKRGAAVAARRVLAEGWNPTAKQQLRALSWVKMIAARIRENPTLSFEQHLAIIRLNFKDPWWSGSPSPKVLYASDWLFEAMVQRARDIRDGRANPRRPEPPAPSSTNYGDL